MSSNRDEKRNEKYQETLKKIQNIEHKIKDCDATIKEKQREKQALVNEKRILNERLNALLPSKIKITDHAVLRLIDRYIGVDTDELRKNMIIELEKNDYKHIFGHPVVIKNNSLLTVNPI
jgi:hypothetical protein